MRLLVVGAGGHAKVVIDAARLCGYEIAGVIGSADGTPEVLGAPVTTDPAGLNASGFIVAVGDNHERARLFAEHQKLGLEPANVIHPSAVIAQDAELGPGTFVAANVTVNPGARIGSNTILNTGCTVDHDCEIGVHVHIGPGANLCGGVVVGEGTLLGVGSCAVPRSRIGEWAVVGAGAAVTQNIPDRAVAVGVPARVTRLAGADQ